MYNIKLIFSLIVDHNRLQAMQVEKRQQVNTDWFKIDQYVEASVPTKKKLIPNDDFFNLQPMRLFLLESKKKAFIFKTL